MTKNLGINGIPFITVIQLKLDQNLKLMEYKIEYSNAKQNILGDETGRNFPWISSELVSTTSDLIDINKNDYENWDTFEINEPVDALKIIFRFTKHFTSGITNKNLNEMESDFIFIVLGSNKAKMTFAFMNGLVDFWKEFHAKYKFEVVYFSLEETIDKTISNVTCGLPWFYYENSNLDLKKKLFEFYGIDNFKSYPKLMIVDSDTGEMLNQEVKLTLLEYVHEFCNKQIELANSYKRKSVLNDLNFDFDIYEICKFVQNTNDSSIRVKRSVIDRELLDQISQNLTEITSLEIDESKLENRNLFYLIYFCSNFTTSNDNIFENITNFLNSIQDKLNCVVKILIVSSDHTKEDYVKLLKKIDSKILNKKSKPNEFVRCALNYDASHVKEKLFRHLNVAGIPWFSLINAKNGEVLGDNLRDLILNSQLRGIQI